MRERCFYARRAAALLLALLLAAACALSASAAPALTQEDGLYAADVQLDAEAYMLVSLDDPSHPVIAQKNKDKREYPASLTKIATAAVALENVRDLQQTTVVSQHALDVLADTGAQTVDLAAGDRVTYEELLYLILVYSACDACQALCEAVGGTEERFIAMMNDWAKSLGCHDTHFVNSHGLHEDDHYTTAADLARMTLAALENDAFLRFAGATSYTFRGKTYEHTNVLLQPSERSDYYPYARGIKTGTTKKAGSCLITKGEKDGCSYLAVLLDSSYYYTGSGDAVKGVFEDARNLLDWAFDSLSVRTVADPGRVAMQVQVIDGKQADMVALVPSEDVRALVPNDVSSEQIALVALGAPASLEAPVTQGTPVCEGELRYQDKLLAKTTLVAAQTVQLSVTARISRLTRAWIGDHPLLTALLLMAVAAVVLLAARRRGRRKRAAKRRAGTRTAR